MAFPRKIVTCCYCGTRAVLVLSDAGRHELACSACGAPLHEMKRLPSTAAPDHAKPPAGHGVASVSAAGLAGMAGAKKPRKTSKWKKGKRRRKPLSRRLWDELTDAVEDAFDDLFD